MSNLRRNLVRTLICTMAVAALASVGCNTVKGLGEDIQSAGEAGEKAISND